jgi:PTS system ascorbate-specific IIA component
MLSEKTVNLQTTAVDWKDVIRKGGAMLVDVDAVEPRYVDAMIHFAEKLGPYIVLAPGLALPHARPEEGVKETWFSLVTLAEPIEFGNEDNDPVYVAFCMAARNKEEHIDALRTIAYLCGEDVYFERIKTAASLQDIYQILDDATEEGLI